MKLSQEIVFITSPFICEVSESHRFVLHDSWQGVKAVFITPLNITYKPLQPFLF